MTSQILTGISLPRLLSILMTSIILFASTTLNADEDKKIFIFEIREEIAPPVQRKTNKALNQAREFEADLIIIDMNTYGGLLESADSIRTMLLNSDIPVYVFINNNAASAGALISIACDSIYMKKGGTIGAATVVNQTGEAMPDKYQSYMRAMMRATAEAKNRDPDIAQGMVDPRISIPGVSDSGRVITFTTSEAIQHGFCEGEYDDIDEILDALGIENYEVEKQTLTAADKIIGLLISPVVSGILIMIIIGGIYFELQTPGLGFPSAAAVLAAMLYFAPLYIEGLAANWEILLFVAGIILIAVEIFAIPGFGVAGISGIVLLVAGLTLSMIDNIGFDPVSIDMNALLKAFFIVVIAAFFSIILSFYLGRKMFTTHMFGHLALESTQQISDGYVATDEGYTAMVGRTGVAVTILRPAGKIEIDDERFDATAENGYIDEGELVKVIRYSTSQLFVRKIKT